MRRRPALRCCRRLRGSTRWSLRLGDLGKGTTFVPRRLKHRCRRPFIPLRVSSVTHLKVPDSPQVDPSSHSAPARPVKRPQKGLDYVLIQNDGAQRRLPALVPPRLPTRLDD